MSKTSIVWIKKGPDGKNYLTLRLPDGSIIHLFKNPNKRKKTHPDYIQKLNVSDENTLIKE